MKGTPMQRRHLLLAGLGVLATGLVGCSSTPDPSSTPSARTQTTIGLTYIPNVQFAPFYVAVDQGLFMANGVDATLRHHGASEGLFTAIAADQEQFVIAGGDELVQAVSNGVDLVAVAAYFQAYPVVVIVPASSPAQSMGDLKGKKVGVPGRYGESWFGLQVALKNAGLTTEDIQVVEIGYTAQAALSTGKVDAVVGFSNNDSVQFGLAGIATRDITIGDDVPLVSIVLATTRALLDSKPDLVKSVATSMVAGIRAVVDDHEAALTATQTRVPGLSEDAARASALATLEATVPLFTGRAAATSDAVTGKLDPASWSAMTTFMDAQGFLTHAVDPATSMTSVLG